MSNSNTSDHSAAASAIGYLYQVVSALVLLLKRGHDEPGIAVSIEKLDDVAFEENGDAQECLQLKHHLKNTATLTDLGTDLWKTLTVWAHGIESGQLDVNAQVFTLLTTAQIPSGSAAMFLQDDDSRNPKEAMAKLLKAAQKSSAETVKKGLHALMQLEENVRTKLFARIYVLGSAPDISRTVDSLRRVLRLSSRPENLESVCERVQGRWCELAIRHLRDPGTVPVITFEEIHRLIADIQDGLKRDNLPVDVPDEVDLSEADLNPSERLFVEQLKLIMLGGGGIKEAISDYYRAFEQRSRWVRDKLIASDELDRYESKLKSEWRQLFDIMVADAEGADEAKRSSEGRNLYRSVVLGRHVPIRREFLEAFLMRGSFHILANDLRVGWHPDFYEQLITIYESLDQSAA